MRADPQTTVQQLLERLVADGVERGIQVAAYRRGELIVDCWAGAASAQPGDLVSGETLMPVFSTTKGIAATVLHIVVERAKISYDIPIAEVWREFAAHGKGAITLRQALGHTAGIPQMPTGLGYRELCDWDFMCTAVAESKPWSAAGSRIEYHAMTFGWIIGETARRIDGRDFGQLVRDEICRPLGVNSLFVGLPEGEAKNVATLEEAAPEIPAIDETKPQAVPSFLFPLHAAMNRADVRRACVPATNGIMNARAIAAHYAALLPSGLAGVRLLPEARVRIVATPQSQHLADGGKWGLGYQLGGDPESFYPASRAAFGHGGYGGSIGVADPELELAIGITKNRFNGDATVRKIIAAIRQT